MIDQLDMASDGRKDPKQGQRRRECDESTQQKVLLHGSISDRYPVPCRAILEDRGDTAKWRGSFACQDTLMLPVFAGDVLVLDGRRLLARQKVLDLGFQIFRGAQSR